MDPSGPPFLDRSYRSPSRDTARPTAPISRLAEFWELPELIGPVCLFMHEGSPSQYYERPKTFITHLVKSFSDLIDQCKKLSAGACRGGFLIDGHSYDVENYLSCGERDHIKVGGLMSSIEDGKTDNRNLTLLNECLNRVGDPNLPLTVTACSGWASGNPTSADECRKDLAAVLRRPIVSTSRACAYGDDVRFAKSRDSKWRVFPRSGNPYHLPGQTKVIKMVTE